MAKLFMNQAMQYADARPTYPSKLFQFIASKTPSHNLVWDVGTGTGQAISPVRSIFFVSILLFSSHPYYQISTHFVWIVFFIEWLWLSWPWLDFVDLFDTNLDECLESKFRGSLILTWPIDDQIETFFPNLN